MKFFHTWLTLTVSTRQPQRVYTWPVHIINHTVASRLKERTRMPVWMHNHSNASSKLIHVFNATHTHVCNAVYPNTGRSINAREHSKTTQKPLKNNDQHPKHSNTLKTSKTSNNVKKTAKNRLKPHKNRPKTPKHAFQILNKKSTFSCPLSTLLQNFPFRGHANLKKASSTCKTQYPQFRF